MEARRRNLHLSPSLSLGRSDAEAVSIRSSTSASAASSTSITKQLTIPALTKGALLVGYAGESAGGANHPSSVKWNGTDLGAIAGTDASASTTRWQDTEWWYIINPESGTLDLVVMTPNSSPGHGVMIYVLENVHQSSPIGSVDKDQTTNGSGATLSGTAASERNLLLNVASNALEAESQAVTSPSGTYTEDADINCGGDGARLTAGHMGLTAGAWSLTNSNNGGYRHASSAVEIRAA